ncbi:hypothetical protein C8J57DRAFT_1705797 [Mycena rebaudengoi]|nr:hypothetical protein C8J57DRAFT_1705797 [Mycena rebaudengoi]
MPSKPVQSRNYPTSFLWLSSSAAPARPVLCRKFSRTPTHVVSANAPLFSCGICDTRNIEQISFVGWCRDLIQTLVTKMCIIQMLEIIYVAYS